MAANAGNVKEGRAVAEKARVGQRDRPQDPTARSSCRSPTSSAWLECCWQICPNLLRTNSEYRGFSQVLCQVQNGGCAAARVVGLHLTDPTLSTACPSVPLTTPAHMTCSGLYFVFVCLYASYADLHRNHRLSTNKQPPAEGVQCGVPRASRRRPMTVSRMYSMHCRQISTILQCSLAVILTPTDNMYPPMDQ